jgi:IS5 family transposase
MKPKKSANRDPQGSLFQVELVKIIDLSHPLAVLAGKIDWDAFGKAFGAYFCEDNGAPGKPVRLMVGLHSLKHAFNLSDEFTVERWTENPYWRHFCGMKYFEHDMPIHPTSMTRWRKKVGDDGMERLLAETIRSGLETKAITPESIESVNVDTTAQEKAIAYPTDARLYHVMRGKLVKLAKIWGVGLRQGCERVSKKALFFSGRYFHARQTKRAKREVRRLKTWLGRVTRDIKRRISGDSFLEEAFADTLSKAHRLPEQTRDSKDKPYSIHAPEVECIAKGKAHKKYEFGNKASFVSASREGFNLGALGLHGNPYDGHTLSGGLEQAQRLCGKHRIKEAFVDRGYRGHGYEGEVAARICDGNRRKKLSPRLKRLRKRRSAIEPVIGHMKNDGRLGRNYLLGKDGDRMNVILCA